VLVVLALEAAPAVLLDCLDEAEERRLRDWLRAHDGYADLVRDAVDLAERDRAA
jgi:hypothetical protein